MADSLFFYRGKAYEREIEDAGRNIMYQNLILMIAGHLNLDR